MRIPRVTVMAESGEVAFEGSLAELFRDNRDDDGFMPLVMSELRSIIAQGLTEPVSIGGGAAPLFHLHIAA